MIDSFTSDNRFLSNFYPARVLYKGVVFPTLENAYQAAKSSDKETFESFAGMRPGQSKRAGQALSLRDTWHQEKLLIMYKLLLKKFAIEELAVALRMTGNQTLVEGNEHGDIYWGVCDGRGGNHLGQLLMMVRARLPVASYTIDVSDVYDWLYYMNDGKDESQVFFSKEACRLCRRLTGGADRIHGIPIRQDVNGIAPYAIRLQTPTASYNALLTDRLY